MGDRTCSVDGCAERHKGYGYCRKHYRRWKKHGDPNVGARRDLSALNDDERRELIRQRARDWYAANRERALANVKAYKEADPERKRRSDREYRLANRERIDQRVKEWNAANRARRREISRKYTNARRGIVQMVPFTVEQWAAKVAYWGNRCWMCGGEWSDMDHVKPISAGGADMLCNLRPACGPCNSSKNAKWPYPAVTQRKPPSYQPVKKGNK